MIVVYTIYTVVGYITLLQQLATVNSSFNKITKAAVNLQLSSTAFFKISYQNWCLYNDWDPGNDSTLCCIMDDDKSNRTVENQIWLPLD